MRETIVIEDNLINYAFTMLPELTATQQALRLETSKREDSQMQINVMQGQILTWLMRTLQVRRALEIGTYTGYSALCMAIGMPKDGRLFSCDIDRETAAIAQKYFAKAHLTQKLSIEIGPAIQTLRQMQSKGFARSFDFAFIDADKRNYRHYYEHVLRLIRPGGVIAIDNVFWGGRVADPACQDEDTRAIRSLNNLIARDARVYVSVIPISDGMTLITKK
jgi:predicted O-methyltransferase YrrM